MDITQVGTSLAIVIICYLVGLGAKTIDGVKDNYIPVIVGAVGGALGAAGMYVIPDFPATDIMTAVAVGIVSGLASTGVNQIYKQVKKMLDINKQKMQYSRQGQRITIYEKEDDGSIKYYVDSEGNKIPIIADGKGRIF